VEGLDRALVDVCSLFWENECLFSVPDGMVG